MADFKEVLDGIKLPEEVKAAVLESWESKLKETRDAIHADLREEYAQRYEHDKNVIIDAIGKSVDSNLKEEHDKLLATRRQVMEERNKLKKMCKESAKVFGKVISTKLINEVKELREDRNAVKENMKTLEGYVVKRLATELKEFVDDSKQLRDERVKILKEGREKIKEAQKKFYSKAAPIAESFLRKNLARHMKEFREDIREAKENRFARELFESFAPVFMASHYVEGTEVRKLEKKLSDRDTKLVEQKTALEKITALLNETTKQKKALVEKSIRESKMARLLSPLAREKKAIMGELLESVQTDRLEAAFKKYLPSVLNETVRSDKRDVLQENRILKEVTGNKENVRQNDQESNDEIDTLMRLIGPR